MRRRARTRILAGVVAPVLAFALVAVVPSSPANANTTRGSSYAAAAQVGAASGLTVQTRSTGLLGFLSPILSAVIDPLLGTLTSVIPTVVSQLTSAIIGTGWSANNTGTTVTAPPAGVYPSSCSSPWSSSDCFGGSLTVGTPSILSISLGAPQGYAAYDSTNGFKAAARVVNAGIHLLGVSLLDLGTVESTAHCDANGNCTQTQQLTGLSLLNGLVSANVANGTNLLTATLGGVSIPVSGLTVPLGLVGLTASAAVDGNLLTVKLGVSLDQLLSILSLGGLLGTNAASIMFTLTVGPGNSPAPGSTGAWGLDLGLDLAVNISISLFGLAGISIAIPTGISGANYGNLLDLKLAYSRASAPHASGGTWYPPGLI